MLRNGRLTAVIRRAYSQPTAGSSPSSSAAPAAATSKVTGLSNNCVKPNSGPVGPGAAVSAEYKVPEYFCFNRFSYAEAEVEMAKFRLPQPNANIKK